MSNRFKTIRDCILGEPPHGYLAPHEEKALEALDDLSSAFRTISRMTRVADPEVYQIALEALGFKETERGRSPLGDPDKGAAIGTVAHAPSARGIKAQGEALADEFALKAARARTPFIRRWYERHAAEARRIARGDLD